MVRRKRQIKVTPERRRKPDYRKISAALQAYIEAQAEVDAEHIHRTKPKRRAS